MNAQQAYEFGPFHIDAGARRLWRHGHPVALSNQSCELLLTLVEHCPSVVTREAIENRVWPSTFVGQDSLRTAVHRLRRTLDDDGDSPRFIEAVAGQGYRFRPPVNVVEQGACTRSLAVLPFDSKDESHVTLGIADAVIRRLCRLRHLVVRSMPTAAQIGRDRHNVRAIGARLRVDLVLDGRLDAQADLMRLALRLLSVADEQVLWAERFEGSTADPFAFEDKVSAAVAKALALKLTPAEGRALRKRDTGHVEARRFYVQGANLLNVRTPEAIAKGIEAFERATRADPDYALAWTALAEAANVSAFFANQPTRACMPRVREMAERALTLDPEMAPAYTMLANVLSHYDWEWDRAEEYFRTAIELGPTYAPAHHWYALHLTGMGRFEEALAENQIALDLDPLALPYCALRGWMHHMSGNAADAIRHFQDFFDALATYAPAQMYQGILYVDLGRFAEAEEAFRIAQKLGAGLWAQVMLGCVAAMTGRRQEALATLAAVDEIGRRHYVPPDLTLQIHLGLGDEDAVLALVERCCDERVFNMNLVAVHPYMAPYRALPRYQAVIRRIGMEAVKPAARLAQT